MRNSWANISLYVSIHTVTNNCEYIKVNIIVRTQIAEGVRNTSGIQNMRIDSNNVNKLPNKIIACTSAKVLKSLQCVYDALQR